MGAANALMNTALLGLLPQSFIQTVAAALRLLQNGCAAALQATFYTVFLEESDFF
jgi:hypothetical protein